MAAVMAARGVANGKAWYQSDHGIFAVAGMPAIAVTSSDLARLLAGFVHTGADTVDRVGPDQLERAARAVAAVVTGLAHPGPRRQ